MNDEHRHFQLAEQLLRDNADKMDALEKRRISHLIYSAIVIPVVSIILSPVPMMVVASQTGFAAMPYWLSALTAFITVFAFVGNSLDQGYRKKAKHDLLYIISQGMNLKYRRGGFITLGDLYDHHVLPPYSFRHNEEGFAGKANGVSFQFQDFHITPVARFQRFDLRALGSWGAFYGVALRVDLGKHLDFHTILMPNFMAGGTLKRLIHEKFQEFDDINLVYNRFKRSYTVLSTDQVEARYVLDPAMMERFMALKDMMRARWLEASFRGRELVIIAGQTKNFFEVGNLLNPVNVLTLETCLMQLEQLCAVIETLDLNNRTGLGRPTPRFPKK